MTEFFTAEAMTALLQVIMIDLVLAGDNAIVIGLAAAGLPKEQRSKAILIGIIAATVLRIGFASITVQLLQIIGLLLAGGVLLLWVCWKMWRELRAGPEHDLDALENGFNADGTTNGPRKTLSQAIWQITIADHPDLRPCAVDRIDGPRRQLHREAAAEAPLDRLCRSRHHSLCGRRHDLSRRA
jgi:predicted tellurium resistance membrane protein TerC